MDFQEQWGGGLKPQKPYAKSATDTISRFSATKYMYNFPNHFLLTFLRNFSYGTENDALTSLRSVSNVKFGTDDAILTKNLHLLKACVHTRLLSRPRPIRLFT